MRLSIIIPVFNGENFIDKAYYQILEQKISDLEIIFIDNNSTDNSFKLLRKIEKQDNRVVLTSETVQGAAAARNKGLEYFTGDYIYFFDVDDELFPNALKVLMEVLEDNQSLDSVFGNVIKTHQHIENITLPEESLKVTTHQKPYWGIRWLDYGKLPGTPSFLHRKQIFGKIGKFNTSLLLGEDAAFMVKLGMECNLGHIDKYVLLYYRHDNSSVSRHNTVQPHKVFTYWEPIVKEHIPYYCTTKTPLEFKKKLLFKTYGSIAKMIALTPRYKARCDLKKELIRQIEPLRIPFFHRPFLSMITLLGSINLYKLYLFYVLRPSLKYCQK